jgi:hypothetical protein
MDYIEIQEVVIESIVEELELILNIKQKNSIVSLEEIIKQRIKYYTKEK